MQYYQKELGIKVTNFDVILDKALRFKNFVDLWEYFAKWERESDSWLNSPILELGAGGIMKTVDEGKSLLKKLNDYFKENIYQKSLITIYLSKINKFDSQNMKSIKIITHPSFRKRHWNRLIKEIYYNKDHPPLKRLTLKILLTAGIMNHKSLLQLLEKQALSEYYIDLKIKSVERSLLALKIRPVSLGAKLNFSMLINKAYIMNELSRHRHLTRQMM